MSRFLVDNDEAVSECLAYMHKRVPGGLYAFSLIRRCSDKLLVSQIQLEEHAICMHFIGGFYWSFLIK